MAPLLVTEPNALVLMGSEYLTLLICIDFVQSHLRRLPLVAELSFAIPTLCARKHVDCVHLRTNYSHFVSLLSTFARDGAQPKEELPAYQTSLFLSQVQM